MGQAIEINRGKYDFKAKTPIRMQAELGINENVVRMISREKNEPEWMLKKRLLGLEWFNKLQTPKWGPSLEALELDKIRYYIDPDSVKNTNDWNNLPDDIKKTFEKLGIPEAERKYFAGAGAQFESQGVYHNLKKQWEDLGVIFCDCDTALQEHESLFKKHFMTSCVPINLHKFAALHAAVWSSGSFIYVPPGVKVDMPLQAYFRMNEAKGGQFEHTLIIVDKGANASYIEGCSSPRYDASSNLHAGCVEIHVKEGARARYTSIENWSTSTYNLNTKRAIVDKKGVIEWVNANNGCLTGDSKVYTNPRGPVNIKDIKKGDKVFAWDDKSNRIKKSLVKAVTYSGIKKVYRLEAGGRAIEASGNHPFLVLDRRKNHPSHKKAFFRTIWKSLDTLKSGDIVGIAKKLPITGKPYRLPGINQDYRIKSNNQYAKFVMSTKHMYNQDLILPEETNSDFMWIAGVLIGDGYINSKFNKINIAVHEKEDIRPVFLSIVKDLFNYTIRPRNERYVEINSKVLCKLFTEIGFSGTAQSKNIPDWVYKLPKEQILAFLSGYFDSDGHPAVGALAFTSINTELLEQVKTLAIMCGFVVSRVFRHGYARKKMILGHECNLRDSWRLHLNGEMIHTLPTRSGKDKVKISKIKTRRNFVSAKGLNFRSKTNQEIGFSRIDKILALGEKPTYDIEVEDYHNFISNGLIVHNSKVTMLYPASILRSEFAKSDYVGIAYAGKDQEQDTGHKVHLLAANTSATVISKSICKDGGITSYRGVVDVAKKAKDAKVNVQCDALMMDNKSKSNTYPGMNILNNSANIEHEAKMSRISEEQLFYLTTRGLTEEQATQMIVSGFIEPISKELPMEYAIEFNRLIQLEMEGSLG